MERRTGGRGQNRPRKECPILSLPHASTPVQYTFLELMTQEFPDRTRNRCFYRDTVVRCSWYILFPAVVVGPLPPNFPSSPRMSDNDADGERAIHWRGKERGKKGVICASQPSQAVLAERAGGHQRERWRKTTHLLALPSSSSSSSSSSPSCSADQHLPPPPLLPLKKEAAEKPSSRQPRREKEEEEEEKPQLPGSGFPGMKERKTKSLPRGETE